MPTRASLSWTTPLTWRVLAGYLGLTLELGRTGLVLVKTNLQSFVVDKAVHVTREVVENFEREVTERLLGLLDPLAGVRLSKSDTKIFSDSLGLVLLARSGDVDIGGFGESVEERDALFEIWVVNAWLKSKSVLDRASKCVEEVECGTECQVSEIQRGF